mmetsp:Transcript_28005/g.31447  ORF Transcript_28005/g.31447 Transcript_28005/m.31447 type:complete len:653 (+) Transcript_28005:155-2113(+)|eukprot:CAMPEP_0170845320 /NCGR_PEP_ID=MMETSP0734-20130129/7512_1 /TAXON_ID=186038 /ORGANISM="Fragilariopsis kerguelensis, Strain L26-C5" /LENGTH=652 /DNA_ID=CAMNT_0011214115 /DNA_START=108 /DNA_END=2066 /DNA_ORIENTATION=+
MNIHAFAHRLTALSMAFLASTGLIFCALSGFGCSFIEIQSLPGRNIGNFNGEVFEDLQTAFMGVQCKTGADDLFYNCSNNDDSKDECGNDRLWDISRLFLYISLVFGGTTTLVAWCLSSCLFPTACRWRVLSILAACSAVFQIPIFLVFESDNCNFDITRQTCAFSTGAYLNIVSVSIWIIMTIWVQLLRAPRWDEELDTWRVNDRNGGLGRERERGIIMSAPKSNNSVDYCNATEETDFASSPTVTQRSPLNSNITSGEHTIANSSYMGSPGIICSAMQQIIGNDDAEYVENFDNNDVENQETRKQSKSKIRSSSSLVGETNKSKQYSPSGCAILPPSIDQILTKEDIEVTAVQDTFLVGETKVEASNMILEKKSGCHNNNNRSNTGGNNINVISNLWGGSRKRSKSTGNISRSAVNIIYDNKIEINDDPKTYWHEKSIKSLIKDTTLPKIEISSKSGKESSSCPQSSHVDDSDNEDRNIADRSNKSISTSRVEPGFKISCVYADGTRHDAHFPHISSYCMDMGTISNEEDEKFRTFPHDHPVNFQEADEKNNTNDPHYLAKKLRKAEDAAATRKARRKIAPVASFEFENSSSLIAEGNNNINNNCDSIINDDISEMTRGSGLASGVSELLDDTDLRHTSREILEDLARTY